MIILKQTSKNLFLHSKSNFDIKDKVNIILSPEYYWCRILQIPIKSKKEVIKVLPNLFEDFVDSSNLKFFVKRLDDGKFLCFGYEESKLIEAIKNANLSINQIKNIYFAQIELESLSIATKQTCIKLDNICLSYIDNILVQIPIALKVNIDNDLDISEIKLSKNIIYINSHSQYISSKYSYILSAFFIFLSISLYIKSISNQNEIDKIPMQIDKIKKQYNMPSTMMQTNSIVTRLKKTMNEQTKLREALAYLLTFQKQHKIHIINISIKNNKFECRVTNAQIAPLKKFINHKYKVLLNSQSNNIITIRFKI